MLSQKYAYFKFKQNVNKIERLQPSMGIKVNLHSNWSQTIWTCHLICSSVLKQLDARDIQAEHFVCLSPWHKYIFCGLNIICSFSRYMNSWSSSRKMSMSLGKILLQNLPLLFLVIFAVCCQAEKSRCTQKQTQTRDCFTERANIDQNLLANSSLVKNIWKPSLNISSQTINKTGENDDSGKIRFLTLGEVYRYRVLVSYNIYIPLKSTYLVIWGQQWNNELFGNNSIVFAVFSIPTLNAPRCTFK